MKIGILSDSHHKNEYLKECIEFLKKENCEYLIHAGDICSKDGLDILKIWKIWSSNCRRAKNIWSKLCYFRT